MNQIRRSFRSVVRATLALVASTLTVGALAGGVAPEVEQRLREAIASQTQGRVAVDDVSKSPIPGIYQVASDGEIFYIDESARFSFVGAALIDLKTQKDLTAPTLEKIQSVDFKSLPLQLAVKEVHGKGTRRMALFEDPNCPVCRVFTKFVDQLDDVTIYRFMYPVIAPQSQSLARIAWCAKDRGATWKEIMAGQRPAGDDSCDTTGLADILKLGEKHRILNTPTVFLGNGKRLVGATPPEEFIAQLNASAQ